MVLNTVPALAQPDNFILLPHLVNLTVLNTLIDDRSPLEPWPVRQDLGELHGDFPAQGWDRVRYMPLGSNGRRVGYNFRVRQVFRGSRRFF